MLNINFNGDPWCRQLKTSITDGLPTSLDNVGLGMLLAAQTAIAGINIANQVRGQ